MAVVRLTQPLSTTQHTYRFLPIFMELYDSIDDRDREKNGTDGPLNPRDLGVITERPYDSQFP